MPLASRAAPFARLVPALLTAVFLAACAATGEQERAAAKARAAEAPSAQDRAAILRMAGDYHVTFDFRETVALAPGYELAEPKLSAGHEIVRVIADEPGLISLQHILVVGGAEKFPVKHWRQDWVYEPAQVTEFVGNNVWRTRAVPAAERAGAWAQIVYQVDDSPRYAAVGRWTHDNGVSQWTGADTWRPLPRRDATTRGDYDVLVTDNRHTLTPEGWVHEQDSTKLVLDRGVAGAPPLALAREIGVNTYEKDTGFPIAVGESYWTATAEFWGKVRAVWAQIAEGNATFALTVRGEPEAVYMPVLDLAERVENGELSVEAAAKEAETVIRAHVLTAETAPAERRTRSDVAMN